MSDSDSFLFTDGTLGNPSSVTLGSPCSVTVGTPSSGAFKSDSDSKTSTWKSSSRLSQKSYPLVSKNNNGNGNKIQTLGIPSGRADRTENEIDQMGTQDKISLHKETLNKDISIEMRKEGTAVNKLEETGGFVVEATTENEIKISTDNQVKKKLDKGLCKQIALCDMILFM